MNLIKEQQIAISQSFILQDILKQQQEHELLEQIELQEKEQREQENAKYMTKEMLQQKKNEERKKQEQFQTIDVQQTRQQNIAIIRQQRLDELLGSIKSRQKQKEIEKENQKQYHYTLKKERAHSLQSNFKFVMPEDLGKNNKKKVWLKKHDTQQIIQCERSQTRQSRQTFLFRLQNMFTRQSKQSFLVQSQNPLLGSSQRSIISQNSNGNNLQNKPIASQFSKMNTQKIEDTEQDIPQFNEEEFFNKILPDAEIDWQANYYQKIRRKSCHCTKCGVLTEFQLNTKNLQWIIPGKPDLVYCRRQRQHIVRKKGYNNDLEDEDNEDWYGSLQKFDEDYNNTIQNLDSNISLNSSDSRQMLYSKKIQRQLKNDQHTLIQSLQEDENKSKQYLNIDTHKKYNEQQKNSIISLLVKQIDDIQYKNSISLNQKDHNKSNASSIIFQQKLEEENQNTQKKNNKTKVKKNQKLFFKQKSLKDKISDFYEIKSPKDKNQLTKFWQDKLFEVEKVPDYKVPVLETKVERYGKKAPFSKKPLRPKTAQQLHVNEKNHKVIQNFKIRQQQESLSYSEKIKMQNRVENEMERKRIMKELELEKQIEQQALLQVLHLKNNTKIKETTKKKENKNVSDKLFYNKVQYHYVENAKTQKIRELKAIAATKKFDKSHNQNQLVKTQNFMEEIHKKDQERKQKIQQIKLQQEQKRQNKINQIQNFERPRPKLGQNLDEEKKKKQQEETHERLKMVMSVPKYDKSMYSTTPAPGEHMPQFMLKLDKQTQQEIKQLREKQIQKQQQQMQFGNLKHASLINQKQNIIKNKNSDGLKVALLNPEINMQKSRKFYFKVISGFSENVFLGICNKNEFLKNFQDKNEKFRFENMDVLKKLKYLGVYMIGNGNKYVSGEKKCEEIPFTISKSNILEISYDCDTKIITFTKLINKKQCQIQLPQQENNNNKDQVFQLFCMVGKINDEIEFINNYQKYLKQQENKKQINKPQKQEDNNNKNNNNNDNSNKEKKEENENKNKEKKEEINTKEKTNNQEKKDENQNQEVKKEENTKQDEKKGENNNQDQTKSQEKKDLQKEKEDKMIERMQIERQKRAKEAEKKKEQQQEKAKILQGVANIKGYFPEAKNKKEITYSFGKLERQDLFTSEAKLVPGPGQYDPVDPKQINSKVYGSFKKGPLPFLSTCNNVKIGKEHRESGGATFMNGAQTGIFYNDEEDEIQMVQNKNTVQKQENKENQDQKIQNENQQ